MTEPTIAREEIEQLERPFEASEYEVREGPKTNDGKKIRWFVYIRREAIQNRLTEIFGSEWETKLEGVYPHGNNVTVCRSITIRGIYRDFTGSASPNGSDDEHLVKSADTDAFKRVASMWGIGLELQSSPMIYTPLDYKSSGTDWQLRAKREQEALNQFIKWLTGEVRPSTSPTPTTNGKRAENGSGRDESTTDENLNPDNPDDLLPPTWTAIYKVKVVKHSDGIAYICSLTNIQQPLWRFNRDMFRDAGYQECETWEEVGKEYTPSLPIPVQIEQQTNGKRTWLELVDIKPSKLESAAPK